jgi:hypothetical protein
VTKARARDVVVVVAVIAACVVGCNSIAGIDPATVRADAGGAEAGPSACDVCMQSECASEVDACTHDAACAPRASCMQACASGDTGCVAACANIAEYGAPDAIVAHESCRTAKCFDGCKVSCGDVPPLTSDVPPLAAGAAIEACTSCIAASCCSQGTACGASVDCWNVVECIRAHTTYDQQRACRTVRFPGGMQPLQDYETCIKGSCSDTCAWGDDWSCVGHVAKPITSKPALQISAAALDGVTFKALGGMNWQLCAGYDPSCSTPLSSGTTANNGVFSAAAPVISGSFDGYLSLDDPSATYLPSLTHADPGITDDSTTLVTYMIQQSTASQFALLLGMSQLDPTRGMALVVAYDCAGRASPGVTFSLSTSDPAAKVYYFKSKLPSTVTKETDATGLAVVVNAPVGPLTIAMVPKATGATAGSVSTVIRAQTLSNVVVVPTKL